MQGGRIFYFATLFFLNILLIIFLVSIFLLILHHENIN